MSRLIYAHCPRKDCPVGTVPDDRGEIGGRRYMMTTYEGHWDGSLPAPRCGFCGGPIVRNPGSDRTGRSTANERNTWKNYTIAAGVKCYVRRLVTGEPDSVIAVWEDWQEYTTKRENTFHERTRARPGYWTFRVQAGERFCEFEFPQLEVKVSND